MSIKVPTHLIFKSPDILYEPGVPSDWDESYPDNPHDAFEQLASRTRIIENTNSLSYSPNNISDWNNIEDPGDINDALDQLASRIKIIESSNSSFYISATNEIEHTGSTGYTQGLRLSFDITVESDYKISWSYIWRITDYLVVFYDFKSKIEINDSDAIFSTNEFPVSDNPDQRFPRAGFAIYHFTPGSYNIDLDFGAANSNVSSFLYNRTLLVEKL